MKAQIERLRARRFQITHRIGRKLRKENYELFTFRHRCRVCGIDTDRTGLTLNKQGCCSLLCEAEHYGAI